MMKAILALVLSIEAIQPLAAAASATHAQQAQRLAEDEEMKATVRRILEMIGLHNEVTVVIEPGAAGCAYAMTLKGDQYIGVDPLCVGPLKTGERYNWRAVAILCHELGHLLSGHSTNQRPGNHKSESEADEWSGWAMFRLGASLEEAQTFARDLDVVGSDTHPGRAVRMESVARGWRSGSAHRRPQWLRLGPGWWVELMKTPLPWPWPERP